MKLERALNLIYSIYIPRPNQNKNYRQDGSLPWLLLLFVFSKLVLPSRAHFLRDRLEKDMHPLLKDREIDK